MSETSKISNSIRWSSLGELLAKLIVPITNMILARVLMPEDFGILASINMIISFVDLFTDSGFAKYIIQCDFKTEEEKTQFVNVAFWTNFGISCFFYILILLFREKVAAVTGNPGYGIVIAIASLQLLITSFSSIQTALFRRAFDFKTLFITRVMMAVIPMVVTVPLAFLTRNYWALVIGSLTTALLNAIVLTIKSPWKPSLYYKFAQLKEMLSFSIWSLAEAVAYWLTNWVDVFLIGAAFSAYYLGLYKNSLNMVNSIMALVKASIIPVLFSTLSRLKNNNNEFEDCYFCIQRLTAYVMIPMGVGLFVYRELATLIMFGSKWLEGSNIVGAWALASCFFILFEGFNGEAYKAKGMPKVLFMYQVVYLAIMIPICIYMKNVGFWAFVYTRSILIIIEVVLGFFFMRKYIGFSIQRMANNISIPLVMSFIMGVFGHFVKMINSSRIWQILTILFCVAVYASMMLLFFRKRVIADIKALRTDYHV